MKNVVGVYRTPLVEVSTRCVFTNTTPVGPIAAPGGRKATTTWSGWSTRPRARWASTGSELRRRNHIRPEQMPYKAPSGMPTTAATSPRPGQGAGAGRLGRLRGAAGREPRAGEAARARHRPVSGSDGAADQEMGGIRFDQDGDVTISPGTLDYGQGHGRRSRRCWWTGSASRSTGSGCAGRQRLAGRRRRHRRVALDDGERRRASSSAARW